MKIFYLRVKNALLPFVIDPPSAVQALKASMAKKLADLEAEETFYKQKRFHVKQ